MKGNAWADEKGFSCGGAAIQQACSLGYLVVHPSHLCIGASHFNSIASDVWLAADETTQDQLARLWLPRRHENFSSHKEQQAPKH